MSQQVTYTTANGMWRVLLSLGVMFAAVALSALGVLLVFLIVPNLWEMLFGPTGSVFAALVALAGLIWCSFQMVAFGDRLIGQRDSHRTPEPRKGHEPDQPTSWPEHTAAIVENKRWAFYRRTGQFDRLAALEAERRAARAAE